MAGTFEQVWSTALPRLPMVELPTDITELVVLAAHPDDETLGAGGLIATAAAAGWRVRVLIATDGAASHPHSTTHTPADLASIRRREVLAAMTALSPSVERPSIELTFASLPDGALSGHRDELAAVLGTLTASPCLLVAPWRDDRHPDHEACAEVAERAVRAHIRLWEYPVWAWHWGDPGTVPIASMVRLPLAASACEAKSAALTCHTSQHRPLSTQEGDEAILTEDMLAHFQRGYEVFHPIARAASMTYFDDLYRGSDDPWGLADRFYELRKREILLASLPREHFENAFEPGCATGRLTELLAQRCQTVLAMDGSQRAVDLARTRLSDRNVTIVKGVVPADWPHEHFDLIVLSEVGYYCPDLQDLVMRVEGSLTPDGVIVACHWRHPAPDHPHTAERVHEALRQRFITTMTHLERDFLLEVLSRNGRSVAQAEGIVQAEGVVQTCQGPTSFGSPGARPAGRPEHR